MRRLLILLLLFGLGSIIPPGYGGDVVSTTAFAQDLQLPNKDRSIKFAVIGDTGTGSSSQMVVAKQLTAWHGRFPFDFAVMLGDNLYGGEKPRDYEKKFEIPYKALLDKKVKFYASLGNHDEPNQISYKHFNMNNEKYYTFKPGLTANARFFALDTNYVDQKQLQWLDKELAASGSDWKIAFFHHPLYSSGETHGSADLQRELIEPVFLKHGVNVVLQGHEHFYERIKPQKGVAYFIVGASAKLRKGDLGRTELTAKGYDSGYSFMLMEIIGDELFFQTINEKGQTVDSGSLRRTGDNPAGTPAETKQPVAAAPPAPKQPVKK